MRTIAVYLPALACGAMMLFICVPMLFRRKHNHSGEQAASQQELVELRQEIARLKDDLELQGKNEALHG